MPYKPPYSINQEVLALITGIYRKTGLLEGLSFAKPSIELRKKNRIKTIQSSLAIEGNSLSIEQVTAILEGKRVLAPQKDILEVKNAIELYDSLTKLKPQSIKDLLLAHKTLMKNLLKDAGNFRSTNVGILKGSRIAHVAPQAKMLPKLTKDLFDYVKSNENVLVMSCVFHYEFEFIHPFLDGNGRLGRFWQTLILSKCDPVFEYLPVESLIKANQQAYYKALSVCDKAGDSTKFIEFMLGLIDEALDKFIADYDPEPETAELRLSRASELLKTKGFTRKDYMAIFKNISTATASRDLKLGIDSKMLTKQGEKRKTTYRF